MDINSLISNYVEKNGGDAAEIRKAVENIAYEIKDSNSVFDYGSEATSEEFMEFISGAADRTDDSFKKDVELLFDILDADGSGDISDEEFKDFTRKTGKNQGKIEGWGLYNTLIKVKTDYKPDETTSSGTDSAEETTALTDDDVPASDAGEADGETTETTDTSETAATDTNSGWSEEVANYKKEIEKILTGSDLYSTPDEVIDKLLDNGTIDKELADELRSSYFEYSEEDEKRIESELTLLRLSNPDATRKDAIESLDGKLGDPVKSSASPVEEKTETIGDLAATNNAQKVYDAMKGSDTDFWWGLGTNVEQLDQVFEDKTLTPDDWVKIINSYPGDSALVSDIDWDFVDGDSKQAEYYNTIVDNLLEAAQNGNQDAITALCTQIKGATAGQTGTADEFLSILFDKMDSDTLYKVVEEYGLDNLKSDIKNDNKAFGFLWWTNDAGKDYLSKIDDAVNKHDRH